MAGKEDRELMAFAIFIGGLSSRSLPGYGDRLKGEKERIRGGYDRCAKGPQGPSDPG